MSGGTWNYQNRQIHQKAREIARLLDAVAETEQIVDRAVAGDTNHEDAGRHLVRLWEKTFEDLYGDPF
jgi:hypothetical protein